MKLNKGIKRILLRYRAIQKHPLTKSNPFMGLLRYLYFNISQSISRKPRKYKWIKGLEFYAEKGDAGLVGNIYYKLMDYEDSMFLIDHLTENDVFVDVGANLGHYTLLASGISKAKTIAIEPIESTRLKLDKNIEINKLENKVTVLKYGVGDKNEILHFTTDKTVMNSVALEKNSNTVEIEVKTLNELLRDISPTFIKIDVEGYEYNVLKGALDVLEKDSLKYLMVEFNNSGQQFNIEDEDVFNLILKYNFKPIRYTVNTKEVITIDSFNKDKFNTLFIREKTEINA